MASKLASNGTPVYTLAEGQPVHDPRTSLQIRSRYGNGGLTLLEDTQLIETLAHFARERIPERVVHAKAAGAWGEFEVTKDISSITSAKVFSEVGKKTKVLARISTVANEKGAPDTVRDIRGFALKFFTEEGNWDMVGNDLPVFFVRDPIKFPSMNRSHKRHPQTNVPDPNMFWDYHNNNPEGIHALVQLMGPRGIPKSLRHVNGYGVHTFKLGHNSTGDFTYVKFHFKPVGGIETIPMEEAVRLAGQDPDYHVIDMFNAIEKGDYPEWTMYIQTMTPEQAEKAGPIVFDSTKIWPHGDYPLQEVGRLRLNKNPDNFFQDIEQAAFSPSNMPPGIAPSADPLLQARMFSYPDSQRYRLGPNYQQLPPNRPLSHVYSPYQRDGPARIDGNYGADPNYDYSSFRDVKGGPKDLKHDEWVGGIVAYTSGMEEEDLTQARAMWEIYKKEGNDDQLIHNVAGMLGKCQGSVQQGTIDMFGKVDKEIGERIAKQIKDQDMKGSPSAHNPKKY